MGSPVSFVTQCAFVPSSALVQTFSVLFLSGASQLNCEPSGETFGSVRAGLPNKISRGISGGNPACAEQNAKKSAQKQNRLTTDGLYIQDGAKCAFCLFSYGVALGEEFCDASRPPLK